MRSDPDPAHPRRRPGARRRRDRRRGRRVRRRQVRRRPASTTSTRRARRATAPRWPTRRVSRASPSRAKARWAFTCSTRLLFGDGTIDAAKPELLVYEPRNNGTMKLVALEYLVFKRDWTGAGRPSLFGQEFDEIKAGNRYGIPESWALHAWIWKPNPSGMLYAVEPARGLRPGSGQLARRR